MIQESICKAIEEAVKDFENINVFYSFMEDKELNIESNYITYFLLNTKSDLQTETAVTVFQVSCFSKTLKTAVSVRDKIFNYFTNIKPKENIFETEVLETLIEEETEDYDTQTKLHNAIITIKILYYRS